MMKIEARQTIKGPVFGPDHDEIVRVSGECLRDDSAQMGTKIYARMLAIWRALREAQPGGGFELVDIYKQFQRLADGVDNIPDAVAKEAGRVARLKMPTLVSFYTQYVSKSFNKYVRDACQKLGLDLIAVLSLAEDGERKHLYLKWEDNALRQRHRSPNRPSDFIAGSVIVQPRQFFGRERELGRLFGLLRGHPMQCSAIVGPPRIGKSSLLRCLETITTTPPLHLRAGQRADWLPEPKRYRWIYLDFLDPRLKKAEGVFRAMLGGLGLAVPESLDQERFLDEMSRHLDQPTIVLMDHIDKALARKEVDGKDERLSLEFWEGLRSLASERGNLAYILASREKAEELAKQFQVFASPFFNIFGHIIQLGPLAVAEARELIASSPTRFPPDDVDEIIKLSERSPLPLQILCSERLYALETGDQSLAWREKALNQIDWSRRHTVTE